MLCQGEGCDSDRGLSFLILNRKDDTAQTTASRHVFCPRCIKNFRRINRSRIQRRQLSIDVGSFSENFRSVLREFSGTAPRRRGRL
jgi:hypothetical protein